MGRTLDPDVGQRRDMEIEMSDSMKVVILAGGFGTRISEESHLKPKPMIEIAGMPILWHIMKLFSYYGMQEFIICAGYKQYAIKEYFSNYFLHRSNITFDFTSGKRDVIVHNNTVEPWKVTVVDTGLHTGTGGRIKRIREYLDGEAFFLTYGDGIADVNLEKVAQYHRQQGKLLTITGVRQDSRLGIIDFSEDGDIVGFREKSKADSSWINGGFMVCNPSVIDYIAGDDTMFEKEPMERLVALNEMACYKHYGFWQCMDTLRDKEYIEKLWASGNAPWKVWE